LFPCKFKECSCPKILYSIQVLVVGGGGGGGSNYYAGAGSGHVAYEELSLAASNSTLFAVVVGEGGDASIENYVNDGESSTLSLE
jgi:hypothetical protein